jgi:hypothetical protein
MIDSITDNVATFGFDPPISPGFIEPVELNLVNILLTQPWDTFNFLDISQGRIPFCDKSTINFLISFGNGRPFTNDPPS